MAMLMRLAVVAAAAALAAAASTFNVSNVFGSHMVRRLPVAVAARGIVAFYA